MPGDSDDILHRVSNLQQDDSSQDIYDDWAEDYDRHLLSEFGYISPRIAAEELARVLEPKDAQIIDYGCGTGLVGEALAATGYRRVDGVDISTGMLEQARAKRVSSIRSPENRRL